MKRLILEMSNYLLTYNHEPGCNINAIMLYFISAKTKSRGDGLE